MNNPKPQRIFEAKAHAGVRQDKSVPLIKRSAKKQGYRGKKGGQAAFSTSNVPFTTQIKPFVKTEIHRLAIENHISDSAVGSALLERALQNHVDMQYGTLLKPIIENEIKKDISGYSNRQAYLSANAFYSAEEARLLVIEFLRLYLKPDDLHELQTKVRKEARATIERWQLSNSTTPE